jgi:membrane-associated phospholipid phosphatase
VPEQRPLSDVSLRWSDVGLFVACYVALVAVWFAMGEIVMNTSAIASFDETVNDWWIDQRTPDRDAWAVWGAGLADTLVKIAVTALIAIAMWLAWKRWREPLMMVVPLVLEAAAFITVTHMVGRPRPENGLESSPVNSSFPSGHVAAAAAYSALVVIVFWHTRKVWVRAIVIVVAVLVPIVVAVSRMYQGMHFLSDVIAGAALGVASVALSWWLIRRAVDRNDPHAHPADPDEDAPASAAPRATAV